MANELTVTVSIASTKANATFNSGSKTGQLDLTGADYTDKTVSVTSAAGGEQLDFDDVTGTPAFIYIKNLDATNFIEIARETGFTNKYMQVEAGMPVVFSPDDATIWVRADTADVNIHLIAVEA